MTTFHVGAATHVGQVRQNNQDSILALEANGLFAVADGMGGHRGGEVASHVAITRLEEAFTEPTVDALVEAVQSANEAVVTTAEGDSELRGMGTTLCALGRIVTPDEYLGIANVGDSRLYLLRARPAADPSDDGASAAADDPPGDDPIGPPEFEQITEDHSLVATLVRQGQITKEEADVHPHKNILTRALGIDARVMVDSWVMIPHEGDRYLICSDGLFNEVPEEQIAHVLRTQDTPQAAADLLVDMANAGGGRDNISVVIVEVADHTGRAEDFDPSQSRVARMFHGSQLEANDREIVDAVSGTTVQGAPPPPPPLPDDWKVPEGELPPTAVPTEIGAPPPPGGAPLAGGAMVPPPAAHVVAAGRSQLTWRVGIFAVAFIAVVAVIAFAFMYSANKTYYVGLDGDQVSIFQGRPGGVLWMNPSLVERTGLARAEVPPQFQADIVNGRDEPDLEQAKQYVQNIKDIIAANKALESASTSLPATSVPGPGTTVQPTSGGSSFSSDDQPSTTQDGTGSSTSSTSPLPFGNN